jgi:hypothetical protein
VFITNRRITNMPKTCEPWKLVAILRSINRVTCSISITEHELS